jgi:sugar phosphate isomerase/epimerase
MKKPRRSFIKNLALTGVAAGLAPTLLSSFMNQKKMFFKISLAQWSLHRKLQGKKLTNLEFPGYTKSNFDIDAVEYVSVFFKDTSDAYLKELKARTDDQGVKNILIMVDGEGHLGDASKEKRIQAVENHYKWVKSAKSLGCHSIRVNAAGQGSMDEVAGNVIDGLSRLSEFAASENINVIVENHGGYSSNGKWLSDIISKVNLPNCGTLPDFGNFRISADEQYDRYKGIAELMPYAKGVSAKSNEFDEEGNEVHTDFYKMLKIVKEAGYKGYIGIEYEGSIGEDEGILATKRLLEKVGMGIS